MATGDGLRDRLSGGLSAEPCGVLLPHSSVSGPDESDEALVASNRAGGGGLLSLDREVELGRRRWRTGADKHVNAPGADPLGGLGDPVENSSRVRIDGACLASVPALGSNRAACGGLIAQARAELLAREYRIWEDG